MNCAGSLRVTEVVGAKLNYQSSHTLGKRTIHYLVLQACYYHQILVDTPHVIDSDRVLDSRLSTLRATSGIPQPHCSVSVTFEDDVRRQPVHSDCFPKAINGRASF